MAIHFSETAPGVHTTAITNPHTDRRHNVAIIESSNAWQLFIDGELAARDLPSFKAAVAEAERRTTAQRARNMVRAACILVMLSVVGASAIGLTKVFAPEAAPIAAVASAETDPGQESQSSFKRVDVKAVEEAPKPKRLLPIEQVVVTVTDAPKPKEKTPSSVAQPNAPASAGVAPKTDSPQAPEKAAPVDEAAAPDTTAEALESATATGTAARPEEEPSVVAEVKPEVRSAAVEPSEVETSPQPAPVGEVAPAVNLQQEETADALPPLPVRAPVIEAPLIRSGRAPIAPEKLSSILAHIQEEAEASIVTRRIKPDHMGATKQRRMRSDRGAGLVKKRRVRRHAAPKRMVRRAQPTRRKPAYDAPSYRVRPQRRMVCFGHTCRFQ